MAKLAKDAGIVSVEPNKMAELVIGTLERLGYKEIRYAKMRAEFTAVDKDNQQIDQDWWSHCFRLRLSWKPVSDGSLVKVQVEEKEGSATQYECEKRCEEIIVGLQDDAENALEVREWYQPSTIHGQASWATSQDLLNANLVTGTTHSKRLLLSPYENSQFLSLPEYSTYHHAIVCGRTGVGKSTGFFIPNLIERTDISMLVTEATPGEKDIGELFKLTAGWREQHGHKIYYFNPADLSSTRINPVEYVRLSEPEEKSDAAEKLAALIIANSNSENTRVDPTWDQSEKILLTALILHAAAIEREHGHFAMIRWKLLSGVKSLVKDISTSPSPHARVEFNGWLNNTSENFRFSVISGLLTKLNPWLSENVVVLTSSTDLDLASLSESLFTIYLAVPSTRDSMKALGAIIFNFIFDSVLKAQTNMPLAMMLDEFTNFGYIPGIAERLSLVRKRKVGVVLGFQSHMQIEKVYGQKSSKIILDQPSCHVYFRQKNLVEAQYLSTAIGKTTVEERRAQHDGRIQEQIIGRDLVSPDELTRLPKEDVIILTSDTKPIRTKKFAPGIYNAQCSVTPPRRKKHKLTRELKDRMLDAWQEEIDFNEEAPEIRPSKEEPVQPLARNLSDKQKSAVYHLKKIREDNSSQEEETRMPESPAIFKIWDMD